MKVFYYIAAHKNPEQVARLVNVLKGERSQICIHVDLKSELSSFRKLIPEEKTVSFVKDRVNVFWAGFSQVECALKGMEVFATSDCDFFVLLSGQDFPTRPIVELEAHLSNYKLNNFILMRVVEEEWKSALERIKIRRNIDLFHKWRSDFRPVSSIINKIEGLSIKWNTFFGERKLPYGYKLFGGSQWFVFNSQTVNYILRNLRSKPELKSFFKYTVCPDEHFFHTILGNSEWKESVIQDNLRYIRFLPGKDNPEVLTLNDRDAIGTSGAFFARKFDLETQPDILERLESLIRK